MSDNQAKFQNLLREFFQFDCAELDFGIYRIMNTKREEIVRFLDRDLLPQVREAFHAYEAENRGAVEAELAEAIEKARELGADPETLPRVKDLRAKLAQAVDVTALENEVYSHLYNFFRRYYSEGDFISLRRYKEGVYAIPYEGEEVKLYWANHDQYYIKTSEYLRNYTFKLPSGKRVHFKLVEADTEKDNNRPQNGKERRFILSEKQPLEEENGELVIRFEYRPDLEKRKQTDLNAAAVERILFMITNSPGLLKEWSSLLEKRPTEKNPNRTLLEKHLTDYTARNTFDYFIHKDLGGFLRRELDFYIKNEVMHLDDIESETAPRVEQYLSKIKAIRRIAHKIIDFLAQIENFQKKLWLKKKFVVETQYCVTLDRVPEELYPEIAANDAQREEWVRLFAIDKLEDSPLPFGERVEREGQTQIKSRTKEERSALIKQFAREMRHAPTDAEQRLWYFLRDRRLGGYKFRRQHPVGNYIADFACIEGRLIVELDGGQHAEIFQQEKDEVKTAFFTERGFRVLRFRNHQVLNDTQAVLEEILRVLEESPHPNPLPFGEREMAFLKAHPYLVLDTRHFSEDFKRRLLASFDDLDEQCDGLLIHSENFQALNLLMERYRGQVKCVYIDPPYNTGSDEFVYRDDYQHSSWLSMMYDRLAFGREWMREDGAIFVSIDDGEQDVLRKVMEAILGRDNFVNNIIWQKKFSPQNDAKWLSDNHDFLLLFAKSKETWRPGLLPRTETQDKRYQNPDNDPRGPWMSSDLSVKTYSPEYDFPITTPSGKVVQPPKGYCWRVSRERLQELIADNRIWFGPDGNGVPRLKRFLSETKQGITPLTIWSYNEVGHNQEGKQELKGMLSESDEVFGTPKPSRLLGRVLTIGARGENNALILDFFAGSGTTAHAVINLNREDGGRRKYILVEMGEYFDTVLVPRIKKVVYSKDWKDGKPLTPTLSPEGRGQGEGTGISHMFKYIRLESYEDTLNNLELKRTEAQQSLLEQHPAFREDYILHYMLDVESRGSASLLNLDRFEDPFNYKLNIATGTVGETKPTVVDLVETFNYLIGLRVKTIRYIDGVCVVTGTNPQGERVLILWRNTKETDNDKLDDWFQNQGYNTKDQEFDVIYVNGDNNLENLKRPDQTWKVRLIEEEFLRRMFDVQDV
jgi:adenine specific DNA methylase Mod/very-short-patch-repair endonuclease